MRGIVTVLNTPFTADDHIDKAGLRQNVRSAIDAGVAGFLVPAMASEVEALSVPERHALIETVIMECAGRVPVIGGTGAPTQAARLRFARHAIDQGCEGVLVHMPYANPFKFERQLKAFADLGPGFIMLQDWDATGPGLPLPFIARLFQRVPAFRWLKIEVMPAGPKYTAVLEAMGGELNVAGGWAVMQMIEALDRGVHALMPTAMHRIYVSIYNCYLSGDRDGARALFERVLPVLAFSNQRLETSIAFFKRLLHRQCIYATGKCRAPVLELDPAQSRIADELIERVCEIESTL